MNLLLGQLGQLAMVVTIMGCAVGGTIGLLKLIKHFSPGGRFPKDPISKKLEEYENHKED